MDVTINLKNHPQTKVGEHILCGYSLFTVWAFGCIENKDDVYRGEDCVKKFCESFDDHFIIKEIAKEFEGKFNYLGENTDKYKTFSVPIMKEVKRIDKNGEICTNHILQITIY